jgi:hypothetical protein
MKTQIQTTETAARMIALHVYAAQIGRTPITLWRWRKRGWLDGIFDIAGKPYISHDGIKRFEDRAARGEFAQSPSGVAAGKSKNLAA